MTSNKIIYLKYGELTLKGKNRMNFVNCLFTNVRNVMSDFEDVKLIKNFDSILIKNFKESDYDNIMKILLNVSGIDWIILGYVVEKSVDAIGADVLNHKLALEQHKTFKFQTKRQDKTFPLDSMQISRQLGGIVLKNIPNIKVDVKKPDVMITVEILKDHAIYYFQKVKGFGGFPLGINGRVLVLLSGGIDSPVAARLLMKKGYKVDFLTFISPPHTDDRVVDKVETLINKITMNSKLQKSRFYIVNFTNLQHEIAHISLNSYQITIMIRYFFRIAEELANNYKYDGIATGEALGQVASQTIQSMTTISNVLKTKVVLRPLLALDKSEIIELAKRFDTYDTSIIPYDDSCSLFVPAKPATKPTIEKADWLESKLELINDIYNSTMTKYIKIRNIG